jgi:MauM/NapG family ferredoxin protein
MNTIREGDFASDPGECVQCLSCFGRCPTTAIEEKGARGADFGRNYDPSRRQVVASLAVGLAGAGLLKTDMLKSKYGYQLRPPGATEADFLSKCVRCGQCVQVCPNNALHLSTFQAGIESLWSPLLIPRIGNCDWECNACGQVCPTQAIPKLPLEEKRKAVIGTAVVDFKRCIRCLICIKDCPVQGAVAKGKVPNIKGDFPIVNADLCIGCGVCEFVCPVKGESAIRVVAPGSVPKT